MSTEIVKLIPRSATAAEWAEENPVLSKSEFGHENDTENGGKFGDDVTPWNDRPYFAQGPQGPQGDVSLSQMNDAIAAANVYGGTHIYTMKGKTYSLVGLSAEERGTQLKLAMSEVQVQDCIMFPTGDYYSATSFVWSQRDAQMIGLGGSSKACYLYSDSAHCLVLDTSATLYNSVFKNFAVGTTSDGLDIDAIHIAPSGAEPFAQSNIEMDLHIARSDRDGIHIEGNVVSGRFIFKTTGQQVATAVDRHMIHCENGSGINFVIDDNQDSIAYLGSNTSDVAIFLRTTIQAGGSKNFQFIDEGTDNDFFSPSDINAFKRQNVISGARIVSPVLEIPKSKIAAFYPLDNVVSSNFLDESDNQNEATVLGGVTITDTNFGGMATFDGVDSYGIIPANAALQAITDKIIISFIVQIDEAINGRIFYKGGFEVQYDNGTSKIKVILNINGGTVSRDTDATIVVGEKNLITAYYDGSVFRLRVNTNVIGTNPNPVSGAIAIGTADIEIGKIGAGYLGMKFSSLYILNDCTKELIESVESRILSNSNGLSNTKNRGLPIKRYEDTTFEDATKGSVYVDRTTSIKYRVFVDNGTFGIEAI